MTDELAMLRAARRAREGLYTVHYACQNLNDVKDAPASVTCVGFYDVNAGAANAFGVSNVGTASTPMEEREVLLLNAAMKFFRDHGEARWVHWKMNRPEYGFQALADRLTWLGHEPPAVPPPDRRHDLDGLIAERHGRDYAAHPRLPHLIGNNGMLSRYARWGAEEPELVSRHEYAAVQQSTTEKVRLLADIFGLLVEGRLQTKNSTGDVPFAGAYLDAVAVVLGLADRFLLVRRALLRRHAGRGTLEIKDEYDAQDLMRALLLQFFDDVRDEEWTPSYGGGASRIDFFLPQRRLAVELKWMRPSLSAHSLGDELLVDRQRYQVHGNVGHLACLVFDYDGLLPNPRGLEQDLAQPGTEGVVACTVKILDR